MSSLWTVACGSGLRDALNPCVFVTCSVFILQDMGFKKNGLAVGWLRVVFAVVYALVFFECNFGPGLRLVLRPEFILAAKYVYFVLGALALGLGVVFFKKWLSCYKQAASDEKPGAPYKDPGLNWFLTTMILAGVLSLLSTVAPISTYIVMLSYAVIAKGLWLSAVPMLLGYFLCSLWPLWLVWWFLKIGNVRVSTVNIFYAGLFLIASSSMLLIFR
jgi:hypothetical protein